LTFEVSKTTTPPPDSRGGGDIRQCILIARLSRSRPASPAPLLEKGVDEKLLMAEYVHGHGVRIEVVGVGASLGVSSQCRQL
jgi:hypothetical protein